MIEKNFNFFFNPISKTKGIGPKIQKLFNEKKIESNIDLIFNFPYGLIDRTHCPKLNNLEIGKISTIFVKVKKHNFPRIRRLPNIVQCYDDTGEINIVFFNSRENYIKEMLPLNSEVIISGKINIYKNKYQITNPDYITSVNNEEKVSKIMPTYSSLKGISNKTINKIYENIAKNIPDVPEWHRDIVIKNNKWSNFKDSLIQLHNPKKLEDLNKNDEIIIDDESVELVGDKSNHNLTDALGYDEWHVDIDWDNGHYLCLSGAGFDEEMASPKVIAYLKEQAKK